MCTTSAKCQTNRLAMSLIKDNYEPLYLKPLDDLITFNNLMWMIIHLRIVCLCVWLEFPLQTYVGTWEFNKMIIGRCKIKFDLCKMKLRAYFHSSLSLHIHISMFYHFWCDLSIYSMYWPYMAATFMLQSSQTNSNLVVCVDGTPYPLGFFAVYSSQKLWCNKYFEFVLHYDMWFCGISLSTMCAS